MGCTAARAFETGEDGFLYAGLADRSGHADNLRFHTVARCTGKRLQRFSRVIDQDVGPVDRAIDDRTRSAVGEGFFEEAMAIHRFAPERDEQIAIDHVPAVHFDPGNLKVMAGRTAYSVGNILCRPQRQRKAVARIGRPLNIGRVSQDGRAHASPLAICAAHSRATSTSSKGRTRIFSPDPMI